MTRRVYVPATRALLARWHAEGMVPAGASRTTATGDDEDSEYDALMAAAAASSDLDPEGGRRVVVVAEVASDAIPMAEVVAVHCDTEDRDAEDDADDDLAWFATQEIPDLI
jgi:hypothetical protein